MPFLDEDDYKLQVRDFELDEITGYTAAIREQAELAAEEEMQSYLRDRYDVATIFSETGSDRNPLIVMYLIDMVLFHLFSAVAPRNVPEVRGNRYNTAIIWLKAVAAGKLNPDLPAAEADDDGNTPGTSIFGSSALPGENW